MDARESAIRTTIAAAITATDSTAQRETIRSLAPHASPTAAEWLARWKEGGIFLHTSADGTVTPVTLDDDADAAALQTARVLATGATLSGADGSPLRLKADDLETAETDSSIRKAMKEITDLISLADPDYAKRLRAAQDAGLEQNPAKIPLLEARLALEPEKKIRAALTESLAIIQLKDPDPAKQIAACDALGEMGSIPSQGALKTLLAQAEAAKNQPVADAARHALKLIASHISTVNTVGTMFRGLSTGSVLLVVAIGLAITFGLMGVINMAHGELIVVGAYTTYVVQNIFATGMRRCRPSACKSACPGMNLDGPRLGRLFRRRPARQLPRGRAGRPRCWSAASSASSTSARWNPCSPPGASRSCSSRSSASSSAPTTCRSNSPAWLSGNWTVNDVLFGWNRVFVIGFAVLIIFATWLVLNKTSLGLLIRAVMQNRDMAACMGVRTERVNMLTFAFGSGLAGLAGAFLSQIGNVGPCLGQNYIVDCFMTVVVGGVGNLVGTVISAARHRRRRPDRSSKSSAIRCSARSSCSAPSSCSSNGGPPASSSPEPQPRKLNGPPPRHRASRTRSLIAAAIVHLLVVHARG